jgi:hypothetical protein
MSVVHREPSVSEEYIASILQIKEQSKQETSPSSLVCDLLLLDSCLAYILTLKKEVICSSRTLTFLHTTHIVMTQNTIHFMVSAVRTSNPTSPHSLKCWEVLESLHNWQLLKKGSAP